MDKIKRLTFDILTFLILIFADRMTKAWAEMRLKGNDGIPLIKNVLELYYLPNGNTGAAFGMLQGHKVFFLIVAVLVIAAIAYLVVNMPSNEKYRKIEILLIFIAAGGAGNMIDRIMQDYVIDFIYISCINFPIFNVADMYVSICTVVLAIILLFKFKEADYTELEDAMTAPFKKKK